MFGDRFHGAALEPKHVSLYVVRPAPIGIDGERLRLQFIGAIEVAFRVARNVQQRRHEELDSQRHQGADIVGIDGERLFAERVSRVRLLPDEARLPLAVRALESQILGVAIDSRRLVDAGAIGLLQLQVEPVSQVRDDLVLRLQQIGARRIELLGPKVGAAAGVDELGMDRMRSPFGCTEPSST